MANSYKRYSGNHSQTSTTATTSQENDETRVLYSVYKIKFSTPLDQPVDDCPELKYHYALFVNKAGTQPGQDIRGTIHELHGNLVSGMKYTSAVSLYPRESSRYIGSTHLGTTDHRYHPALWEGLLRDAVPVPGQQAAWNAETRHCEIFKHGGEPPIFYADGNRRPKAYTSTDWIEAAVIALRNAGYLYAGDEEGSTSRDLRHENERDKEYPKRGRKHEVTGHAVSSSSGSGSRARRKYSDESGINRGSGMDGVGRQ